MTIIITSNILTFTIAVIVATRSILRKFSWKTSDMRTFVDADNKVAESRIAENKSSWE